MKVTEQCRAEALSYLGCRGNPPPELAAQVERAFAAVRTLPPPRLVWRELPLERRDGRLFLGGTVLSLPGEDIAALLRGCGRVILLAATMGREADTAVRRAQASDLGDALALDCCLSAAVESACEEFQAGMEAEAAARGEFLTDRYSPGYGDLPLSVQRGVLEVLDAPRKIGLTVTPEGILLPRKSVTALMGIAASPQPRRRGGCRNCPRYEDCQLRKDGITCGK